jgi:mannosyltransferase OCH1-like enzyme
MKEYILFIIIIIIFIIYLNTPIVVKYSNEFPNDENDLLITPNNSINTINVVNINNYTYIPLNIFMTWKTKNLTPEMQTSIDIVKKASPEFNIYIYDNEDCRNFLKKYFIKDVLESFDNLKPGAFKADLWRYCVLYYYGGIYQDIKYQPNEDFKYISLSDKEYFVKDRPSYGNGIYNALLVCKPKNLILYKCIKKIIKNVKNKFYGCSSLQITGPLLITQFFTKEQFELLELSFDRYKLCNKEFILKNNKKILINFKEYRKQQSFFSHYPLLYYTRRIYN